MTVVLVAASVEVKIELTESTAPAAIKMLKVRIVIPPNNFLLQGGSSAQQLTSDIIRSSLHCAFSGSQLALRGLIQRRTLFFLFPACEIAQQHFRQSFGGQNA